MQIQNKRHNKRTKTLSSNSLFDDDFASGFEDNKFDKFKPALKVFIVAILLMSAVWGVSAYFSSTDTENDTNKNYTPDTVQQAEDTSNEAQDTEAAKTNSDSDTQRSETPTSSSSSHQPSNNSSTPTTKPYDPSKCEPLNNEATRLRQAADQKKTTYDNAFAASKNYGYFYDKYGNSTDAQQAYNNQEAQLNSLQAEWEDALNKGNAAYGKYQECRANL